MGNNVFRIISSAATRTHDKAHILKHLSGDVEFIDITDNLACLGIFGPKSRKLMSSISEDDFSNENFSFGNGKYIKINSKKIWAQRLSFVGELGFELYIKSKDAEEIYDLIIYEGRNFNLSRCGAHAMDTMRMESGFLHWGHDISPEENQYQANLQFAISYKKEFNFIGKKALIKIRDKKKDKRLTMFTLKKSLPGHPLLLHDEPIYLDNVIIGRSTSGNYSFNYRKNLSFAYIDTKIPNDQLTNKDLYIEVQKKKYLLNIELEPLKSKKIRFL